MSSNFGSRRCLVYVSLGRHVPATAFDSNEITRELLYPPKLIFTINFTIIINTKGPSM